MEHKTKHEDNQKRENEVANFWRTWMSKTLTKTGKMAAPLYGKEEPELELL
jgi:hypothetical protein